MISLYELCGFFLLVLAVVYWWRGRELNSIALSEAKRYCKQRDIQLLDQTLAFERFAFSRASNNKKYFSRIYYDAVLYDPGALSLCIDIAGPEKVLFGTDFPMPCDVPKLYDMIATRPADEAKAIKGGNAVEMFGL